jgi:hypothetical protein
MPVLRCQFGVERNQPVRGKPRSIPGTTRSSAAVGQYSSVTTIVVLDQDESIAISFDDLLKYHGRSSITGVAHAFKAMERAFPLLSPGEPPDRYVTVEEIGAVLAQLSELAASLPVDAPER